MNIKLLLLACWLIISCNKQNSKPYDNKTIKDTAEKSLSAKSINIEEQLKKQTKKYLDAFNGGDPNLAIYYCYSDMFVFFKNQNPDFKTIDEVKSMLKGTVSKAKEKSKGYVFVIDDIKNRVEYNSDLIFTINVITIKNGVKENSKEIIGVSIDNGKNWKFLTKDPKIAPGVLSIKYPKYIIENIMS